MNGGDYETIYHLMEWEPLGPFNKHPPSESGPRPGVVVPRQQPTSASLTHHGDMKRTWSRHNVIRDDASTDGVRAWDEEPAQVPTGSVTRARAKTFHVALFGLVEGVSARYYTW
ncbi:hypothetical protein Dimus_025702 [Dionaea muscipula]